MRKLTCGIIGFLAVVFISGVCFGATIYVDQSGGGDYTTINAAISNAYSDDTVYVGPGVYEENVVITTSIKLIGSGPKYTFIQTNMDGITVEAYLVTEIANFSITAGNNGITLHGSNSSTIKNCIIEGCGASGIYIYNKNYVNLMVTNNTIASNSDDGIRYSGSYGSVNIQGNIIVFNGGNGVYLSSSTENNSYNNIYGNSPNYYSASAGTGDISLNPLFYNMDESNYVLQSSSPSIDTGVPSGSYNDPDGTRNDMGAYAGSSSAAFWPYIPRGPVVTEIFLTPASVPRGGTLTIQANGRVQ